jgi:cyclophilin family peptidyl-prolyl cis-trans isomerase/HEAT repeat protein
MRDWRKRVYLAAAAAALFSCRSTTPPPGPATGSAPTTPPPSATTAPGVTPPPRSATVEEVTAGLLELEDRRAFRAGTIEAASRHGEASVRARAALAVGRIGDDRGVPILETLLGDADASVRASAAFGAQLLGDGAMTAALLPKLADPDAAVAGAAASAISSLGRPDGVEALIAALPSSGSPEPRAAMVRALWRAGEARTAAAALPYADDPDATVRKAALYALARKPVEGSRDRLTAALSDADTDAAAWAARALGLLGKPESLEPLAATLDSGRPHLVTNALVALEAILEKSPGAPLPAGLPARALALSTEANPNIAIPALVLLRQFAGNDRQVRQRLWSVATSGAGRRREVALQSSVSSLKERALAPLDSAIESPEVSLRGAAADCLAFLPVAAAAPRRARLAADPSPLPRAKAIGSLSTPEAVIAERGLVEAALKDPDAGVRSSAVDALGGVGDAEAMAAILEAVKASYGDANPDVALSALDLADKKRGDPAARAIAEAAWAHPRTMIRRRARTLLVSGFRADAAAYPMPEYDTGRTANDYREIFRSSGIDHRHEVDIDTAKGTLRIVLENAHAPLTVANFLKLVAEGYFNGAPFHRIVPNFVVQDGDPSGTGWGGPGWEIRDEHNMIPYGTGTVGMALSGPDTGGSQWFITHSPQPHLDGRYTVFGRLESGGDVLERLEQGDMIQSMRVRSWLVDG